jgi:hypothetical protein
VREVNRGDVGRGALHEPARAQEPEGESDALLAEAGEDLEHLGNRRSGDAGEGGVDEGAPVHSATAVARPSVITTTRGSSPVPSPGDLEGGGLPLGQRRGPPGGQLGQAGPSHLHAGRGRKQDLGLQRICDRLGPHQIDRLLRK